MHSKDEDVVQLKNKNKNKKEEKRERGREGIGSDDCAVTYQTSLR